MSKSFKEEHPLGTLMFDGQEVCCHRFRSAEGMTSSLSTFRNFHGLAINWSRTCLQRAHAYARGVKFHLLFLIHENEFDVGVALLWLYFMVVVPAGRITQTRTRFATLPE
jgi:hypothetical protein